MTADQYRDRISANLANAALNQVIGDYATVLAERDALQEQVESLKAGLAQYKPAEPQGEADPG